MGIDDGLVMKVYEGGGGGEGKAIMIAGIILFCLPPILGIMNIKIPGFVYGIGVVLIIAGVVVSAFSGGE